MRVDVVTVFPQMFEALTEYGITGRAIERGLLQFGLVNPRDYTHDRHRTVDDRPYGGGPGMVLMPEPLKAAIHAAKQGHDGDDSRVVYLSPQGRKLTQAVVSEMVRENRHIVFVSGRYEGIDERLIETEVDEEISIGDYVLSGGELAAMVVVDAITRLLPDALGHEDSASNDTFGRDGAGGLLEYPQYTRPEEFEGLTVPEVLLSGDHQAIRCWRMKQALGRTWLKRPEMMASMQLNDEQRRLLDEFIHEKE